MDNVFNTAQSLFEYSQFMRRDFHMYPELGFQENRTSHIVAKELEQLGIEVKRNVGKTGVVGLLEGKEKGRCLLLRFDMDALPIQEDTQAVYASKNNGVMHACGHDGHIAIGLTVAKILKLYQENICGVVKFMFQPAEEGLGGAESMLDEGVSKFPSVDYCLAMHLMNEKPVGWVGISSGPVMAGADIFSIRIEGKGGHGALPHQAIDPVAAASYLITAIQTIVSRNVSPQDSAVISVTRFEAGETYNIIPQFVKLAGTIRTFRSDVRQLIHARLGEMVKSMAQAFGCNAEMDIRLLTPAVVNDPSVTKRVHSAAARAIPNLIVDDRFTTMVSEDMAYVMDQIPGCYFFAGSGNVEKKLNYGHHHPKFDFDEAVLVNGAAMMAASALEILSKTHDAAN